MSPRPYRAIFAGYDGPRVVGDNPAGGDIGGTRCR